MSNESQFDREEEAIIEAENRGEISHAQARKEIIELQRDYRAAAEESALEAYEREMERW